MLQTSQPHEVVFRSVLLAPGGVKLPDKHLEGRIHRVMSGVFDIKRARLGSYQPPLIPRSDRLMLSKSKKGICCA
jgi:hypothetical protein